jgi:succinyl-diaminopimelate desuccinylase
MHNTNSSGTPTVASVDRLWAAAEQLREPLVTFARRLIQTPSLPGQEGGVANLVVSEMQSLGYDEVSVDEAGNVIGQIRANAVEGGDRTRRTIMLNAHMDHVDVGDHSRWPHPPYAATLLDGEIWGRGASDLKGSLACQVYAGAVLLRAGLPRPNDVYVAGVVQEELGGLGSSVLAGHLKADYCVIGEPSNNELALGHRGRTEIMVTVTGKSVHASVPDTGVNPLYTMSRLLLKLEELSFEPDPEFPWLGPTTVAPTLISTDQTSANVVPGECTLVLDLRNTPADTPDSLLNRVREMAEASLGEGASASVRINAVELTSYTGITRSFSNAAPAFGISPDDPLVSQTRAALNAALRRDVPTKIWPFSTDAGHLVSAGIKVIGFGPGVESVIHTVNERISVAQMVEAVVGNAAIALAVS